MGNLQCGGNVFQPLALLSSNALVGEQGKVCGAYNFLLGLTSYAARRDGKLCQNVSFRNVCLNCQDDAAYVVRASGLILDKPLGLILPRAHSAFRRLPPPQSWLAESNPPRSVCSSPNYSGLKRAEPDLMRRRREAIQKAG